MNWDGLVLYPKGSARPILVVLSDPFPVDNPKIVVAVARACCEWDEDDIVIPAAENLPDALCVEQTNVDLVNPVKVKDQINPSIYNKLTIAGNVDLQALRQLRQAIDESPHVKGAVKHHLKAWTDSKLPF